jgi:hypothetical protein
VGEHLQQDEGEAPQVLVDGHGATVFAEAAQERGNEALRST